MSILNEAAPVNLDDQSLEDLTDFFNHYRYPRTVGLATLLPEVEPGRAKVAWDLAGYAFHKATAMRLRAAGSVGKALEFEDECDRIYKRLPEHARW